MDTLSAFAMGQANRGREQKVFDWDKAARLIKEHEAVEASAGLSGDWEYTGGCIFSDGKPVTDSYTYLSSTWATPEIEIDGEMFNCYVMASDVPEQWGTDYSGIKWPESALSILRGDA